MDNNRKQHWENVYETKSPNEVSWTQEFPKTSLDFIASFGLDKQAGIIDIGGGDSKLVDYLVEQGYENISVLDISAKALERAKVRLGTIAEKVNWIESDITDFNPKTTYDVWHDRATFHFLTTPEEVSKYKDIVEKYVTRFLTIGTFSENGPKKCSGLDIKQYNENSLSKMFNKSFEKIRCMTEDHITPFDTTQNFIFCSFKKNSQ